MKLFRLLAVTVGVAILCQQPRAMAQSPEMRTARYLDSIRSQPPLLDAFLRKMPKGGDLHNHLSGAVYAETYIQYAVQDGDCVDSLKLALVAAPCSATGGSLPAAQLLTRQSLYDQLVDAMSMRGFHAGAETGHDHFFATFGRFSAVTDGHEGDMLAEVASSAAAEHVTYLELLLTPDHGQAERLGVEAGWNGDFEATRQKLLNAGLKAVVANGRNNLDQAEARMRAQLECGEHDADPGCGVTVRYQYQVLRGMPPAAVYAQILAGFEMAQNDPRVVGLNLVMPEDGVISMRDFTLHMHMIGFLHRLYPGVRVSLHAGELSPSLVPPEGLRFHIRQSVEMAHASRIGHGVDVMHEDHPLQLLQLMAQQHVAVEICLTSNDVILGIRGADHPFPIYLSHHVPVVLATDDMGVSRSDMTREYLRAVETYRLDYLTLKRMVRDSLDYSFLPGSSLWTAPERFIPASDCAGQLPGSGSPVRGCAAFLKASPKAALEWEEEGQFRRFENSVPDK
jgi:adenosine deaminase